MNKGSSIVSSFGDEKRCGPFFSEILCVTKNLSKKTVSSLRSETDFFSFPPHPNSPSGRNLKIKSKNSALLPLGGEKKRGLILRK